jgi:hypothetical protein
MRKEWECPIDCPNRRIGCQNPNTCEIYAKRVKRSLLITGDKKVKADNYVPRSTPTPNGKRKRLPI